MSANFIKLDSAEKLEELFQQSHEKPVLLFKHSTTCPISAGVYEEVSRIPADVNLIVIQSARNLSSTIAEKTGIRHESPQAIILKDGEPIYHASHFDVTAKDILAELGTEN